MRKNIIILCLLIILVALFFPVIIDLIGALTGILLAFAITVGTLLFTGFILLVVFSGVGLLLAGVVGLVGLTLLAVALPFLAPLFIVLLPVIILLKLIAR